MSMSGEEFLEVFGLCELREYIIKMAKQRNKLPQLQEEYCQEAWLVISCAPGGYSLESYKELAYRAIYSAWWPTRREYMLTQCMTNHLNSQRCKTCETATDNDDWFMSGEDRRRN